MLLIVLDKTFNSDFLVLFLNLKNWDEFNIKFVKFLDFD